MNSIKDVFSEICWMSFSPASMVTNRNYTESFKPLLQPVVIIQLKKWELWQSCSNIYLIGSWVQPPLKSWNVVNDFTVLLNNWFLPFQKCKGFSTCVGFCFGVFFVFMLYRLEPYPSGPSLPFSHSEPASVFSHSPSLTPNTIQLGLIPFTDCSLEPRSVLTCSHCD